MYPQVGRELDAALDGERLVVGILLTWFEVIVGVSTSASARVKVCLTGVVSLILACEQVVCDNTRP